MRRSAVADGWVVGLENADFVIEPEDVGFGHEGDFGGACPWKDQQATKADHELESWEDRKATLSAEYRQVLLAKMKVTVLHAVLPKDLPEKVLDERDGGKRAVHQHGRADQEHFKRPPRPMEVYA